MPWNLCQSNFQLWTRHISGCRLWRQIFRCLCLALTLTAFLLPVTSVRADGGAGGASGGAGGAGGTGTNGAAGTAGGNNLLQGGGGGGGGGAGGGTGGAGGSGVGGSNASGGTSATPNGANGSTAILGTASAGGGGGGAGGTNGNGAGAATIANIGPLSAVNGGSGGAGGNASVLNGGGGGGGGAGGYGALITGTGSSSNSSMISAGDGGAGGAGGGGGPALSTNSGGNGGSGGSGGIGASFSAPGATFVNAATATVSGGNGGNGGNGGSGTSLPFLGAGGSGGNGGNGGIGISASGLTLTNAGTINGGSGGAAGSGGTGGTSGAAGTIGSGGIGIAGSNLTVVNSGTISGGLAGDGVTRANAISFTGGSNSLELDAGSSITGNVVGTGSDTFKLGGSANSTFAVSAIGPAAQYRGFSTFQKVGTSTWTLTGATSAATPWTLLQGALSVSSDSNLGAAAGALTFNGGTLQVTGTSFTSTPRTINWGANGGGFDIAAAANVFSLNQSLTGTGSLTKLGAGTLLLSGANTYGGGTTISAGTLQAGAANTLSANSSISVAGGATLDLNGFDQSIGSLSGSGNATLGGARLTTGGDNTSTAFSGLISGSGGIIKAGSGTFTLLGANSYNGGTTISAGTLLLSGSGTLGATSNTTTVSGGTLNLGGTTQTQAALNQSSGTVQTGTIHVANYQLTGGTLASDATVAAATTFDMQAGTANGVLAGGGALNKTTAGTVTLAGTNGYSGGTTISAGTLLLSGAGTLGATSNTTAISGGTLNLGGTTQTQAALNQSSGTVQTGTIHVANYQLTGGTLASDATVAAATTFDMQAGTANGVLAGGGALNKTTAGTVTLAGTNGYSGGTTISAGTLLLSGAGTLGATSNTTAISGGTLNLGGTTQTQATLNQAGGTVQTGTIHVANYQLTGGTLASDATVAATTTFDMQAGTANGVLAGGGALNKTTAGTVTLAGTNGYSGGTTISAGTLLLSGAGTLGATSNTTTVSGGTLNVGGTTQTQAALNQAGGTVQTGTIHVANYQLTGGTLASDATVAAATTFDMQAGTANGVLAGGGALNKTTAGTVTLAGTNGYSGGTTISAGTLLLSGAGTLGATSNTTAISGGTLNLGGTTQTQAALNQAGGTVQTGTIHVANYQLTGGTLASDATVAATTTFDMQAGTANGVLTGTGALTKTTAGTVVLSGANSYSGNTSISAGILRAGAADTLSANSAVSVSGGATLDLNGFNQTVGSLAGDGSVSLASATLTTGGNNATTQFAGTISGGGGVTKDGTGVFTLSGANSYLGTTTVNGGTLSIAADSNLGNGGSLALNDNTTLNFAAAFTLNHAITLSGDPTFNVPSGQTNTIAAAIADGASPGDLVLTGGGTLILSAANSYTGTTTVNAGTLRVDGSIATSSLTSVNGGAVLTGLGTLGNTEVHGGGTLVPGAAGFAGTSLTIAGTLTLAAGSIYSVTISAATASNANVSGTATLAGNVLATFTVGAYVAKQYTILHSGGLSGAFSSLQTNNLPAGFTAALSYSGLDAFLNLTATLGNNQNNGQNNQTVADSVNSYFNTGGALPGNFARVYALTGDDLRFALAQLSGEAMTGGQEVAAAMTDGFLVTMLDPFVNAGGAGISRFDANFHACRVGRPRLPRESPDPNGCLPQWSVWSVTYGATQSMKGDPFGAGTHDFDGAVYSSVSGLDYHLTSETVVGFAAGGGSTIWSLAQGLGAGRSSAVQAGLYAVTKMGGFYVADALSFANHWVATDRYSFDGDHLMTNFGAQAFGERFESGYRLALPSLLPWPVSASWLPPVALTPYVAFEAQDFQTPTVNEQDLSGGGFGLSYAPHHSIQAHTELGTRISIELLQTRGMSLNLWARAAWAYGVVDDTPLDASFQSLPGTNLEVQGVRPARNSAITTLGCALDVGNGLSFAVTSDAHFADNAGAYEARATLRYAW